MLFTVGVGRLLKKSTPLFMNLPMKGCGYYTVKTGIIGKEVIQCS